MSDSPRVETLDSYLRRHTKRYLIEVMTMAGGNVTVAARIAGRHRTAFHYILRQHGIDRAEMRRARSKVPEDLVVSP